MLFIRGQIAAARLVDELVQDWSKDRSAEWRKRDRFVVSERVIPNASFLFLRSIPYVERKLNRKEEFIRVETNNSIEV